MIPFYCKKTEEDCYFTYPWSLENFIFNQTETRTTCVGTSWNIWITILLIQYFFRLLVKISWKLHFSRQVPFTLQKLYTIENPNHYVDPHKNILHTFVYSTWQNHVSEIYVSKNGAFFVFFPVKIKNNTNIKLKHFSIPSLLTRIH